MMAVRDMRASEELQLVLRQEVARLHDEVCALKQVRPRALRPHAVLPLGRG